MEGTLPYLFYWYLMTDYFKLATMIHEFHGIHEIHTLSYHNDATAYNRIWKYRLEIPSPSLSRQTHL